MISDDDSTPYGFPALWISLRMPSGNLMFAMSKGKQLM